QRIAQVGGEKDEVTSRHQHAMHLTQHRDGVLQVLEDPEAYDEVERLIHERQPLSHPTDHGHAWCAMLVQRGRIRVEPGGKPDVAPEQLDDAATAAADVEHAAFRGGVAADHRLEVVTARPPLRTDGAVALAIRVL